MNQQTQALNPSKMRLFHRIILILFKMFLLSFVIVIVLGVSFLFGCIKGILNNTPEVSNVLISPSGYYSTLLDKNGDVMQTLVMEGSNRQEVSYEELPQNLINAFIAIEDERYWQHNGIDIKGIFRAAFIGLTTGKFTEGASTITQQLIKNNIFQGGFETGIYKIERKLQEQYLALRVESELLSKKKILEYYLNSINLGNNTLGVESAAQRYFGKHVSDLTLSECAVLAATTSNPSARNPVTHPEKNRERQQIVLQKMLTLGFISKEEYDEAYSDDVYSRVLTSSLTASTSVYSYYTDAVIESVLNDLIKAGYTSTQATKLLYSGGLTIYTNMNPDIQAIVDEEINNPDNYEIMEYSITYTLSVCDSTGQTRTYTQNDLKNYHKTELDKPAFKLIFSTEEEIQTTIDEFKESVLEDGDTIVSEVLNTTLQPQTSFIVIENGTGYVSAISGGRGEKTASRVLNRATDSTRQPGSAFKTLAVYAPAIDTCGATLATTYYDSEYSYNSHNFVNWWGSEYLGYCNIRQALAASMNIIAVKCLMNTVSPSLGITYLQNFGITTLTSSDNVPSLALGGITYGVTNLELTAAYATIENQGVYVEPTFYTKVLDHNGKVLLNNEPETRTVLRESTAALLTDALISTVDNTLLGTEWNDANVSATNTLCKLDNMSTAGKSGTTSDQNDLWFVGYTPYYTAGIWSGYDETKTVSDTSGYHKKIWAKIMNRMHEGLKDPGFSTCYDLVECKICSKSGLLAIPGVCDSDECNGVVYTEKFVSGTEPLEYCNRHNIVNICTDSNKIVNEFCPKSSTVQKIYLSIDINDQLYGNTEDTKYTLENDFSNQTCTLHHEPDITKEFEFDESLNTFEVYEEIKENNDDRTEIHIYP
ncbi:MAG: transglycosylase domain-containing protein [Lachnospiraceae bacterium]